MNCKLIRSMSIFVLDIKSNFWLFTVDMSYKIKLDNDCKLFSIQSSWQINITFCGTLSVRFCIAEKINKSIFSGAL